MFYSNQAFDHVSPPLQGQDDREAATGTITEWCVIIFQNILIVCYSLLPNGS